jgi:hypothetical protein
MKIIADATTRLSGKRMFFAACYLVIATAFLTDSIAGWSEAWIYERLGCEKPGSRTDFIPVIDLQPIKCNTARPAS